jgi:outer membrane protein assembly factor BamB
MTTAHTSERTPRKPLRLWPGVVAVALQWLIRFVLPVVVPGSAGLAIVGGAAGGVVVLVWWLFFSRAPWLERVGAIALMVAAVLGTYRIVHLSIANGMMGMMLPVFVIPLLSLALVAAAAAGRRLSTGLRRASMAGAILLACGVMTLVRTAGVSGDGASDLHWRWTRTPEERLLAQAGDRALDGARDKPAASSDPAAVATPEKPIAAAPERTVTPKAAVVATVSAPDPAKIASAGDWPGFRGPARDGVVRGVRIETDWSSRPPVALWRRAIGPGWSSFAVHGDLVYTQEQRGDQEVVSCYRLTTGEPVWRHSDAVRFYESNGGPGPRGTPTVRNGRVYTMGATGLVNALDAGGGAVVWSRNAANDTGAQIPGWGFAGSPLVLDDLAIVAASGRLVAYDVATGQPRWVRQTRGGGYSSPHFVTIDGVAQIVLLSGGGATGVAPSDGTLLWEHSWQQGVGIVQPAVAAEHDVLIAAGDAMGGLGLQRLAVTHGSGQWTVEERWTSRGLKPYFNDFVLHKGHAFGFDGSILSCIDLADGTRKWKGGRYGHGQLVLLADQDVLLVLSEDGGLALVGAAPDRFTELARLQALEGKTWNHPVLVGNILLVRNGEEMAAYRLPLAGR